MPHATSKFPFEFKLAGWAATFSERLAGDENVPFLVALTPDGRAAVINFGTAPRQHDDAAWEAISQTHGRWITYDPFDAPEYTYLAWQDVSLEVMQRITGTTFAAEDFVAAARTMEWPATWGVMF